VRDWHSIFEGNAPSARALTSILESKGLHPFIDDRQGPIISGTRGRVPYSVVLVSPDEAERAGSILRHWEVSNVLEARSLTHRLARIFGLSLIPELIWLFGYLIAPRFFPQLNLGGLLGLSLVSLIAIAQKEQRHHREQLTPTADKR
jgi:hypothetical protein